MVNKKRIPEKYQQDSLLKALNNTEINLDKYFDEQGYIVAAVNRISELDKEITGITKRITNSGKEVFEVLF